MFQLNSLNPTRISSQNVSSTKSKTYDLDNDIKIQCFNKDQILFVSFFSLSGLLSNYCIFIKSILT